MRNLLENILIALFTYKFTILAVLYFCVISVYPVGSPRLLPIWGACTIIFMLNILGKTKYTLILKILFSIFVSFSAFFAFIYKSYINIGLLGSMVETNTTEAGSMMKTAWLPASVIFVITTFLILMSCRELKKWKFNRRKSVLAIGIYLFLLSPALFRRVAITDLHEMYNEKPQYVFYEVVNHYSPLVYGNVMTIVAYANEMIRFREYAKQERVVPQGIVNTEGELLANKIYFVLGESSTRVHYSLYGYGIATTPFLDKMRNGADSLKLHYYNALAPASYTRNAVPIILSTATARDPYQFYKEKTILELAKLAGYEVIWISNQPRIDRLSVMSNYVGDIAQQANHTYFFPEGTPYGDLDLVPIVDQYRKGDDTPQLFIIHLAGSHQAYCDKYREEDRRAMPYGGNQKDLKNDPNHSFHYDRAIHYTDRVLQAVNNLAMKDSSSVLYYTPDHGEDVGVGHGLVPLSRMQFEVPLIIVNKTVIDVEAIVRRYVNPVDSLISNANSMYILSEIMGYSVTDPIAKKSVEEGKYVIHGDAKVYRFNEIEN